MEKYKYSIFRFVYNTLNYIFLCVRGITKFMGSGSGECFISTFGKISDEYRKKSNFATDALNNLITLLLLLF